MRDRSWKEIGPALGSESQFRNAHKTKRATLVLASVALLAAVAHVTNKKSTNKNLFSDRGHPGCLPPQVTRVPKKPLAAVHWANGCQLPLLNTARGGLRVVAKCNGPLSKIRRNYCCRKTSTESSSSNSKYRSNTKMDGRNDYQNGQSNPLRVRLPFFLVHHLANSTANWWHGDDQN